MRFLITALALSFSWIHGAHALEVKTLPPHVGEGQINVQIPARSIYQYTSVILCDSPNLEMRRFSSFFKDGMLYVDLRYQTFGPAFGASCSLYFVIDDLAEFDYETGNALHANPQFFRFVVQ